MYDRAMTGMLEDLTRKTNSPGWLMLMLLLILFVCLVSSFTSLLYRSATIHWTTQTWSIHATNGPSGIVITDYIKRKADNEEGRQ